MKLGTNDIDKIYLGTSEVTKVYLGTNEIYPSGGGTPPTTYLQDDFNDTNGTALTSHTMDVGSGWTLANGLNCGSTTAYTIESNRAESGSALYNIAWAEAGVADGVAKVDLIIPNVSDYYSGIVFRFSTCANYWAAAIGRDAGGTPYFWLVKVEGGTRTTMDAVNITGATNSTVTITVTLSGNDIVATANTGESVDSISSFNNTATKFGLWAYIGGGYSSIPFENFLMTN